MKHVKLFEDFSGLDDLGTLKDTVDYAVDEFEEPESVEGMIEAAAWTCNKLGLKSTGERLAKLGLSSSLVPGMDLTEVVEIWNSNYWPEDEYREIAALFPKILGWSTRAGAVLPPKLEKDSLILEEIDCRLYECPSTGVGFVRFDWVWGTDQVFMLRSDLAAAR